MQFPKHEHYLTAFYFVLLIGSMMRFYTKPSWLTLIAYGLVQLFLWLHRLEDYSNKD